MLRCRFAAIAVSVAAAVLVAGTAPALAATDSAMAAAVLSAEQAAAATGFKGKLTTVEKKCETEGGLRGCYGRWETSGDTKGAIPWYAAISVAKSPTAARAALARYAKEAKAEEGQIVSATASRLVVFQDATILQIVIIMEVRDSTITHVSCGGAPASKSVLMSCAERLASAQATKAAAVR